MKPEQHIHSQICKHLKSKYPGVSFFSDLYDRLGRNGRFAFIGFRSGNNPDLFIALPKGRYSGLFIEVKNGKPKKSKHLIEQEKEILKMNNLGYFACFAFSFEEAKQIIDGYMKF